MNQELYNKCSNLCDKLTLKYHVGEHIVGDFTYEEVKEVVREQIQPELLNACSICVYGMLKMRKETINNEECCFKRYYIFNDLNIEYCMRNNLSYELLK